MKNLCEQFGLASSGFSMSANFNEEPIDGDFKSQTVLPSVSMNTQVTGMLQNSHILATKLVAPTAPVQLVPRPRLQQPEKIPPIILVCAPAGYGKTTLIVSWLSSGTTPVAWHSLDAGDNDPVRFLAHFVAAIQSQFADFGHALVDMLESSPPPPIVSLMRLVVNQLCSLPGKLCLILDDVHTLTEPEVHQAIAFLIEHQPPQLQLILASRDEPPFSLARMRAQRKLLEYRAADLRFTLDETEKFCNEVMHFGLPPDQVQALSARTEGWIVGLQLAAVSLHENPDKTSFINNFAGDDRHITDFLLDEVLQSRSQRIQDFLLQTSLLERFNAPLCNAVTGQDDSRTMIDQLERANLFILGLDHQRTWYRYHHLFMSLLQNRLLNTRPDLVRIVHLRASRWFSENDLIPEAIEHAFKAVDHELAVDLMEKNSSKLFSHGQISRALVWAQQLPPAILAQRPILSINCAWASYYMDNLDAMELHINAVAECLKNFHDAPFGSKEQAMLAQVDLLRGCHFALNGNGESGIVHFRRALAVFSPGRTLYRVAAVGLGFCYSACGRLEEAQKLFEENSAIADSKQSVLIPITGVLGLGRIHLLHGRLQAARQLYEKALQECLEAGWQDFPACGLLHIGLGELAYETNELSRAEQHLSRGVEMTAIGMQYANAWGHTLLAQTRLAMGVSGQVLDETREMALLKYSGRFIIDVSPLSAAIARLWLQQNRLEAMARWRAAAKLPEHGELAVGREAEYLMLARYFFALKQLPEAHDLLERLWQDAEAGMRVTVMIEIRILQALVLHEQGDVSGALIVLQQGVELAEKTGMVRIFVDSGRPLGEMLKKLTKGANYTSHIHRLLGHFSGEAAPAANETSAWLPMLFSKKEKQVVTYIIKGATNQQIATALFISANTLGTHLKNIYAKLQVNSRLQAIERLRQLGFTS